MNNECHSMEPLIYLYRNGELSPPEKRTILNHTATCSHCREILSQLHDFDLTLQPLREEQPLLSPASQSIINETMSRILHANTSVTRVSGTEEVIERFAIWLKPAIGITLTALSILFTVQQSVDVRKVSRMEENINLRTITLQRANAKEQLNIRSFGSERLLNKEAINGYLPHFEASIPVPFLMSGLSDLFQHDTGLLEELAKKYPDIATITLDDGLDEREKQILSTEGNALLKDIEQLIHQGEQKQ